jgi:phosphotransferase system  glucose/maltose/N-acetylglucosamine-specific IIC component
MDSIDITDSSFYLGIPDISGGNGNTTDHTIFIYIGIAILVAFIFMFTYKFYMNKKTSTEVDCEGGFCTMNNSQHDTS